MRNRGEVLALLAALCAAPAAAQVAVDGLLVPLSPAAPEDPGVEAALLLDLSEIDLTARDHAMRTPLHRAASVSGDAALIRAMVALGADPRAVDAQGLTPLHLAARDNPSPAAAAALIAVGAQVDAVDAGGATPLALAADAPWNAALLILAGADACRADASGRPALGAETLEEIRRTAPDAYPPARRAFLACLTR